MPPRNAIVLSIDRLGAGFLGPYGNTWIDTPHLNRLAAEGVVVENFLADSPDPVQGLASAWTGVHHLCRDETFGGENLPRILGRSQITTVLVTDESHLGTSVFAEDFGRRYLVDLPEPSRPAEIVQETHTAQLIAEAIHVLSALRAPFLLWVHCRGMAGPWDAPVEYRRKYAEGDDPLPKDFTTPPSLVLPPDYDPDTLLPIVHTYAGQVALLDVCIGALLESIDQSVAGEQTILLVTSPRGFPLGEHLAVGDAAQGLYGELLHAPCMARTADSSTAMRRLTILSQPHDLFSTLLEWFEIPEETSTTGPSTTTALTSTGNSWLPLIYGESTITRPFAVAQTGSEIALRTPAWHLRIPSTTIDQQHHVQLYVKPDDAWEMNDVADRCPQIVEMLLESQAALCRSLRQPFCEQGLENLKLPEKIFEGH